MSKKIECRCENCGAVFYRYQCQIREHTFCCRECARGYLSEKMARLNRELNPTRMRDETRRKISATRKARTTPKADTYEKTLGRHTHRIVAERKIGRPLRPGEIVHHIDGDKHNNDPGNLEVFENQAEHAREHNRRR